MAPVPAEKKEKKPPSALALAATGFGTVTKTVGFALSVPVFLTLMSSFMAHLKIKASQWYALRRIKKMEEMAVEQDQADDAKEGSGKNRRRDVNWERESMAGAFSWS